MKLPTPAGNNEANDELSADAGLFNNCVELNVFKPNSATFLVIFLTLETIPVPVGY